MGEKVRIKFTQEEKERIITLCTVAISNIHPSYIDSDVTIIAKLKIWAEEPRHSPEKLDKVIDFVRKM